MFEFIKVDDSRLKNLRQSDEPTYVIKGEPCDEYWRSINNGSHLVSTGGRIYSNLKKRPLSTFRYHGYEYVKIGKKPYSVARLLAEAFNDDVKGQEVHHIDGNRHNNTKKNLQVLSSSEHKKEPKKNKLKTDQANKRRLACPIAQLNTITLSLIDTFDSIRDATIAMGKALTSKNAIREASLCPGYRITYGYRWLRLIEGLHYTISKKEGKTFDFNEAAISNTAKEIEVKAAYLNGRKSVIGINRKSPTGEKIDEIVFESISAAAEHLGISHKSILDNMHGKTKWSRSIKDKTYWTFKPNKSPE